MVRAACAAVLSSRRLFSNVYIYVQNKSIMNLPTILPSCVNLFLCCASLSIFSLSHSSCLLGFRSTIHSMQRCGWSDPLAHTLDTLIWQSQPRRTCLLGSSSSVLSLYSVAVRVECFPAAPTCYLPVILNATTPPKEQLDLDILP
jgi:hypothetical protein